MGVVLVVVVCNLHKYITGSDLILENATEFFGGKIRAALKWGLTSLSFANKSKDHHCRKETQ